LNFCEIFEIISICFRISFFNEISLLTSLCHPNIIHAYGLCSEPTISLLTESSDLSTMDLYQYLQHYKQEQQMEENLYASTIFFATQICSALAYLESLHIYHRDIAARNCFVSLDLNIKIHDLAMCNEIYTDDYVLVSIGNDIQTRRPIRWCAWETICLVRKKSLDFDSMKNLVYFRMNLHQNLMFFHLAYFFGKC
jgi:serine/threonine protein kinase